LGRRRKKKNKFWPIVIIVLMLAALGGAGWLFLAPNTAGNMVTEDTGTARSSSLHEGVELTIGSELWLLEPELGHYDDVVQSKVFAARDAVREEMRSPEAWATYAHTLFANGLNRYAEYAYKRAARLDAGEYKWTYLAGLTLKDRDPIGALVLLDEVAAFHPAGPAFYVHYADALAHAGRTDEASAQYRKALEIDPKCARAFMRLAEFAGQQSNIQQQLTLLRQAVDAAPDNGDAHSQLAKLYHQLGDAQQAELCELRARRFSTPPPMVDEAMSEVLFFDVRINAAARQVNGLIASRQYDLAESKCRDLIRRAPENPEYLALLGSVLTLDERSEEAASDLRQALASFPNDQFLHHQLGKTLFVLGQEEEGLSHLRQSVALSGDHVAMQVGLGEALMGMDRLDDAAEVFERALEIEPSSVRALYDYGLVLQKLDRGAEALAVWEKSISIDPLQGDCYFQIGSLLAEMGDYRKSMQSLRKSLGLNPNDPMIVATIAWHLASSPVDELRNGPEAVTFGRVLYDRFPNSGPAIDLFAAAQAERGDFEEATRLAERAVAAFEAAGQPDRAEQARERLELYRDRRPYRFPTGP
jgi:tetratricopeptide (TPR) repeat protein